MEVAQESDWITALCKEQKNIVDAGKQTGRLESSESQGEQSLFIVHFVSQITKKTQNYDPVL